MRFKMYQITYMKRNTQNGEVQRFKAYTEIDKESLFQQLNKLPLIRDEDHSEYTVLYCKEERHIILATFIQAYNLSLTKFVGESKEEVPLQEDTANDKTYFYIDTIKGQIFIQNKRYQSDRLNAKKTFDRIEALIGELLQTKEEYVVKLLPNHIAYSVDDLTEIFKSSIVKHVEFRNLLGLEIPKGTKLHNPREYLDDALAETWNIYCKDQIDYMDLKSPDEKSLNKNPFAKIGMVLSKEAEMKHVDVIKKITILDSEGEVVLKPKDNEHKIINISKKRQKDAYESYDVILKSMIKGYSGRF